MTGSAATEDAGTLLIPAPTGEGIGMLFETQLTPMGAPMHLKIAESSDDHWDTLKAEGLTLLSDLASIRSAHEDPTLQISIGDMRPIPAP